MNLIPPEWWPWIGFNLFVLLMLALDLGVINRTPHVIKVREALIWSAVWVCLALFFNAGVWAVKGDKAAMEFLAGYLIEKSLSVDNIFVFVMIFGAFKVAPKHQHSVLFWGIIGALLMRAAFIAGGITLIKQFHWIIYVFGALLVFTAIKIARHQPDAQELTHNPVLKLFDRFVPTARDYDGEKFFIVRNGRRMATPLFVALVLIETTDVIFAVDSIPAILAVTDDPFIVYTSNIFAILGLRSLYFGLAGVMKLFHYLHYGLAVILAFVGAKMLISDFYKVPIGLSLAVIAGVLAASILFSVWLTKQNIKKTGL